MTTPARETGLGVGQVGAVFGALALGAIGWLVLLTYGPFDPPEVVRIVGASFLPIGIGGAIGAAIAGRHGQSRPWAMLGLALAGTAVVAMVVLQLVAGY